MNRLLLVCLAFWAALILACGGSGKSPSENLAAAQQNVTEADALWDRGEKLAAVAKYKESYGGVAHSSRAKFLPRIIEVEIVKENAEEIRRWMERGLDDKLEVEYTDPTANKVFTTVRADWKKDRGAKADDAKRKAAEERDVNGLVLLLKTVKGKQSEVGGEITGTVVNRRDNKLAYVQILFNLYDASGAQVGSAIANVNGLEPGGRWNFKASSLGTDFSTYKLSELTGY